MRRNLGEIVGHSAADLPVRRLQDFGAHDGGRVRHADGALVLREPPKTRCRAAPSQIQVLMEKQTERRDGPAYRREPRPPGAAPEGSGPGSGFAGRQRQRRGGVRAIHLGAPGRVRLRVDPLYRSPELRRRLERGLAAASGIRRVAANELTANVLVLYDDALDPADVLCLVAQVAGVDVDPEPAAPAPAPASSGLASSLGAFFGTLFGTRDQGLEPVDPAPSGLGRRDWHAVEADAVIEVLGTDPGSGLHHEEAGRRLERYGPNRLQVSAGRSDIVIFAGQFLDIPVGMLGVSALVSVVTGGVADALVILAVAAINGIIGFVTERQAERTIRGLSEDRPRETEVLRAGEFFPVGTDRLVPGDILLLDPGNRVAADVRLLESRELSLDESSLTGESLPVEKDAKLRLPLDTALAERRNMAFMGTSVVGGNGRGVVVATAATTEIGQIQTMLGAVRSPETPMQRQLGRLGAQLAYVSGAVCLGVFAVGLVRGLGWLAMLKASVSLAVAAVPEGLPAVATTTLAIGIAAMRRRRILVRQLAAVESLGAVQTLCLDKTGTLTENRMRVERVVLGADAGPNFDADALATAHKRLLAVITLCSEVDCGADGALVGSSTEVALVELARQAGIEVADLRRRHPLQEIHQRAEGRPVMSSFHRLADAADFGAGQMAGQAAQLVAAKGSPEELLARCDHLLVPTVALDEAMREAIRRQNERMAAAALRVLGVAYRIGSVDERLHTRHLVWLGLVAMADPLRHGMGELMREFQGAGIKTVMITGDQAATAEAVGRALALSGRRDVRVLESNDFARLDPQMLQGLVADVDVFARVSPAHKLRIVQAYQQAGRVVAMTGDGVNDGPALKAADVGVAMGKGGSEVARSVADLVLEEDDLHRMLIAVRDGRAIYNNIRKTVHFLLATNFSEIELMALAIALGLGSPLNPMQLLWINLLSDIFPGLALAMEPPEEGLMKRPPRDPEEPIVTAADLERIALESAVITGSALGAFGIGLARYGPGPAAGSLAFNVLTTAQLLHALSCRSQRPSLFALRQRVRNPKLELALGGSLAAQVLANLIPRLRGLLGLAPLTLADVLVILAGAVLPLVVNEGIKAHRIAEEGPRQILEESPA